MDSKTLFDNLEDSIQAEFSRKIENIFLNALHRKNYFFVSKEDLEDFVSKYCTCLNDPIEMENIYYVKGEAFLKHNYKPTIEMDYDLENRTMKITGGSYSFL